MPTPIRDRTRLLLGFDIPARSALKITARLRTKLGRFGLVIDGTGGSGPTVHHTWRHLWVRDAKRRAISDARITAVTAALRPGLSWAAPVQRDSRAGGSGLWAILPDVLLVAPRPGADQNVVKRTLGAYGLREWEEKSKYLGRWRYFTIEGGDWDSAPQLASTLLQQQPKLIIGVTFEVLAQASPFQFDPNDLLYPSQWNLLRIGAPQAWDLVTGAGVVVAVLDSGCDLAHADLSFAGPGLNLDDMISSGSPVGSDEGERSHGTLCAGVIGAGLNNWIGIAGLAGGCRLLPIAQTSYTQAALAMGIRYAMAQGARVVNISASFAEFMFDTGPAREAIEDAVAAGLVLCASSGNGNSLGLLLPARHPAVLACGASDHADMRWQTSPSLGSNYGDSVYLGQPVGISVVAPGLDIHSTDLTGPAGLTPFPSPGGDYQYFNATSASTPHVSAVAALLLSRFPALTSLQVRRAIERTAEKTGGLVYSDVDGYPAGTRYPELGYGRLSAFHAVDFGDVMIADWPGDDGIEPSTPPGGVYWETSDLVVRPADDGVFDPTNPDEASVLVPGRDHTVYIRVRNVGPADARNVQVEARVTPWVGLEFIYPSDWTGDDALHLRPTPVEADFSSIPAGGSVMAKFTLTAAQVDSAAGWGAMPWHPCLLGVVTADNDYAFQTAASGAGLQTRWNNLAQRNLTVGSGLVTHILRFPFIIGHPADPGRVIEVVIDGGRAARDGRVQLVWEDDGAAFPALLRAQGLAGRRPTLGKFEGGVLAVADQRQALIMTRQRMVVRLGLTRPGRYPLHLSIRLPRDAKPKERFTISVVQRSLQRGVVGGATWIYTVNPKP